MKNNPEQYKETQYAIKQVIAEFIEQSPFTADELSSKLGRAPHYLRKTMEASRMIGMKALSEIDVLIPIPKALKERAAIDLAERMALRARNIRKCNRSEAWKSTVESFKADKPVMHMSWTGEAA